MMAEEATEGGVSQRVSPLAQVLPPCSQRSLALLLAHQADIQPSRGSCLSASNLQVRDAGNLLTRAGLNIPSVDVDEVTVHYSDPDDLVDHLRCTI